ncbi:uncharacterized protein CIMG_05455 [Coccidioides immitis RS]|uniref:Uncharacterized protein n=3 Tax=Coccidioides immitis TaxID=5501 RepID=J3KFL7_COCIM|nr:uncharacterized protein CIMG_05455 [Coccidioides immitis RS]EAS34431.3 hypothetical protein CIMG_05455 [Coccidioides immitis RS]KMP05575.1 hypothetical protein CIRG_05256 [Coccidioides immitis RMSCC 2394]KMU91146.1 hypothetical protein CIHG_08895 [Coccidioides immitis H538.4]TPX21872.1 hypothetical protein DIZ76_015837 [Coccidioides immitis]
MALTLRRHHTYEYGAFREMLELHAPYSIIREYIPGILNYIVQPGSSRRPLQIDITSVLARAPLLRLGSIPRSAYKRCLNALLDQLHDLQFSVRMPRIMARLMEDVRRAQRGDWVSLLCTFACYRDLLDRDRLHATQDLCDDLSLYVLQMLHKIAEDADLSISLSFVDLLEKRRFHEGMEILWEALSRSRARWFDLYCSRGEIDLYLSGQPSRRIMKYVRRKRLTGQEELSPPALTFGLGQAARRRRFRNPYDSDDSIDGSGGLWGGGRRGRQLFQDEGFWNFF